MPTPVIFNPLISGLPLSSVGQNNNWALVESSFADIGPYVSSGLIPTVGTGLSVNVSSGTAVIGAHLAPASFVIGGLANGAVNDLYLRQNGTGTSLPNPSSQPANSVKLGTATTAAGVVTSVNLLRSSGRQVFVRPENQVPGAVGSMGSINLASWAAAAADGVPVFGVLPAGAVPAPTSLTPPATMTLTDSGTSISTTFLTLTHHSSATPIAGFGTALEFGGDDNANVNRKMGQVVADWLTPTSGSTVSEVRLKAALGNSFVTSLIADGNQLVTIPGTLTVNGLLTHADGANIAVGSTNGTKIGTATTQKLGFFNAAPVAQPGNTTDLRTGLINLGFLAAGGATPLDLNGGSLTAAGSGNSLGATTHTGDLTLSTHNLVTDTTTGTKLGTSGGASGQKLGFFNTTPIVQPLLATGAAHTVDDVITTLQNLGLCRQT